MNAQILDMAQRSSKPRAFSYMRFSRPEQELGDSLRRQTESSERYAREHGLELDKQIQDRGISAFRGRNSSEGALRGFIDLVRDGTIPKGSFLLIEKMDRLSRQPVEQALALFLQIIDLGISIVTLDDGRLYRKGALDIDRLNRALGRMERAHEESATKSERLSASWENKRANAGKKKLTALCPGWLELSEDRAAYKLIPDRAALIRRVFAMTLDGQGRRLIANTFNREGIQPWGRGESKGDGWQDSYIAKILSNPAVIGEYQPHKMQNGKRVPVGDVLKNYFPPVIKESEFHLAKKSMGTRKHKGGQVGLKLNNVFSGIAVCSQCGGAVVYCDKGSKDGQYLVCSKKHRGLTACKSPRWKYANFETSFIKWLVDFDFSGAQKTERRAKEERLATVESELAKAKTKVDRLYSVLENSDDAPRQTARRITELERDIEILRTGAASLKAEIESAEEAANGSDFQTMAKDPENRFRLREEIRKRVERITVYFVAHPDFPTADPAFNVEAKDGNSYMIYSDGSAEITLANGRTVTSEQDPDTEQPKRKRLPMKRRRR
jgi:DNA invertase Pin-like site-specific DNA recombinase